MINNTSSPSPASPNFATNRPHDHNELFTILLAISISIPIIFLNLFTLYVMCVSKTLRQIRHAPVASFILASAVQSMFVLPIYLHRTIEDYETHREPWVCDLYRFPYFFTQHIIKLSLFVNSVDRLVALKYPYRYSKLMNKTRVVMVLFMLWIVTFVIDSIPFFLHFGEKRSNCYYTPTSEWGLCVILFFDIFPFITIIIIYVIIWRIAATVLWKIETQKRALRKHTNENNKGLDANSREKETKFRKNLGFRSTCSDRGENITSHLQQPQLMNGRSNAIKWDGEISTLSIEKSRSRFPSAAVEKSQMCGTSFKFSWEMKATRTSVSVCAAYAVCWLPMGIFYFIDHLCTSCLSDDVSEDITIVKIAIKCICLASSIFLPLVYCWSTKEFRREVMKMFCKKDYYRKEIFAATRIMLIDSAAAVIPSASGLVENML